MRIGVYGICLGGKPTGIANVVINCLNSISEEHTVIIFSNRISEESAARLTNKNIILRVGSRCRRTLQWAMFGEAKKMIEAEQLDFLWLPMPLKHVRTKKDLRILITVNDFVGKEFRGTMVLQNRIQTRIIEPRTIRRADNIWCISEYTKNKLIGYYPKRKCENIYVGCAADPFLHRVEPDRADVEALYEKTGITRKFLMFVGSLEPRKNLSFLLKVFREFRQRNEYQLVVVGGTGWGETGIADIINEPGYPKDDVLFPGYLSMEELRLLYNTAECYVSTSLNEGFGLPQLEAMNCGCPVVTAHNSAMIEVAEGAGITVEGWDTGKWTEAIEYAINNRQMIIARQDERRQKYTWEKVTKGLLEYMEANK